MRRAPLQPPRSPSAPRLWTWSPGPYSRRYDSCRLQGMLLTRRMFVAGAAGFALLGRNRGMSIHLSCGALGVKASQTEAIDYAARFGFDSVDANAQYLGGLSAGELSSLLDGMKSKNVAWAIAGFPTE